MTGPARSDSRHVVISGGTRGLGRVLVEHLLGAGYRVSTCGRRETEFVAALRGDPRFFFAAADISDAKACAAFARAAEQRFGRPYGLVNCAGVAIDGVLPAMREDQIDELLATNLAGTLKLTRLVVRRMLLSHEGGSIVMISSVVGLRGYNGLVAYGATKGGLDAAARARARELGGRGIRVNSVAPGYLETEMTHGLDDGHRGQIVRRTPLNRLGLPEDVVGPVLFLLSDASRFITGQTLVVDGGLTS
jgi:3-oxoacyl-[acyl-carrier protein] reductase